MKIKVNNTVVEVDAPFTVEDVVRQSSDVEVGVAVAVNGSLVRRPQWSGHSLIDGDDVVIIKAAYGG